MTRITRNAPFGGNAAPPARVQYPRSHNLRSCLCFLLFFSLAPVLLADPVRKVDFSQVPDMKELATRARQLGNEVYPKILAMLGDDSARLPQHFDIVFKKRLGAIKHNSVAGLTGGLTYRLPLSKPKILFNSEWLAQHPEDLDMFLVHEMAHAVQDYKLRRWFTTPYCWREGIPDYVCYKLGYANASRCAECSLLYPHYTSGYTCAGAFLLYVDALYGSNVVAQLNREIRHGSYLDKFFPNATGQELDHLWLGFQKTPAYTPSAADLNPFHAALGYVRDKPPRDVQARFETYLQQRPAEFPDAHKRLGYVQGKPP